MKTEYTELPEDLYIWCNTHQRRATHEFHGIGWTTFCCSPRLGGITMPCHCVNLTGMLVDYSWMYSKERAKC